MNSSIYCGQRFSDVAALVQSWVQIGDVEVDGDTASKIEYGADKNLLKVTVTRGNNELVSYVPAAYAPEEKLSEVDVQVTRELIGEQSKQLALK